MNEIISITDKKYTDDEILRAVYALNMCTVSVSQIIDYNDIYILEQEYDAILNNLNLEKMPKADALKKILVELLNTISFFRIQDIKKATIDERYQKRLKNAIWKAIPNLNVVVAGSPAAIGFSIASQVGISYMNYRREKNDALSDKEKEELELRITAIEQFHALRRELFTTAWELSEEYEFEDRLRLSEKQIRQYNQILMDRNEIRKYNRLKEVQNDFDAFPAFWYQFGHTACYIADKAKELELDDKEKEAYRRDAIKHFNKFKELNKFNILREDQMAAAGCLEHADLLLLNPNPETYEKVAELLSEAENKAGSSLDLKQLCAITHLKIGNTEKAANLLEYLVNEGFNTLANAKLLSRIYVSQYLNGTNPDAKSMYRRLAKSIGEYDSECLFPMPELAATDQELQEGYLSSIKFLVSTDYKEAIIKLLQNQTVLFNKIFPAPYECNSIAEYYAFTDEAQRQREREVEKVLTDGKKKSQYLETISEIEMSNVLIDLVNRTIIAYDDIPIWKMSEEKHEQGVEFVKQNIIGKKDIINQIQRNITEKKFSASDYKTVQTTLSVNAPVFCHGIALLNCHRTAHFSVWNTPGASALGMSHLLHGFV